VTPENLFPLQTTKNVNNSSELRLGEEEMFAFSRVVSRLNEMQTKEYLESKHIDK
jgi:predicted ATPase